MLIRRRRCLSAVLEPTVSRTPGILDDNTTIATTIYTSGCVARQIYPPTHPRSCYAFRIANPKFVYILREAILPNQLRRSCFTFFFFTQLYRFVIVLVSTRPCVLIPRTVLIFPILKSFKSAFRSRAVSCDIHPVNTTCKCKRGDNVLPWVPSPNFVDTHLHRLPRSPPVIVSFAAIPNPNLTTHARAVTILVRTAFADLRHLRFDLREFFLRTDG